MGEEDKLPNRADRIFFAPVGSDDFKELPIVEDSVSFDDVLKDREREYDKVIGSLKPLSLSFSMPLDADLKNVVFDEAVGEPFEAALSFYTKPRINRPKNLKYPNKKRARRIWKKWRKRYGESKIQDIFWQRATVQVVPNGKDAWLFNAEQK